MGVKIGVKDNDLSPWYNMTNRATRKYGLWGLLLRYNSSLYSLLSEVYPEHDWVPWKFNKRSGRAKNDPKVIQKAVSFVEIEMDFTQRAES